MQYAPNFLDYSNHSLESTHNIWTPTYYPGILWSPWRILESQFTILELIHRPGVATEYIRESPWGSHNHSEISWNSHSISWNVTNIFWNVQHNTLESWQMFLEPIYNIQTHPLYPGIAHIISWNLLTMSWNWHMISELNHHILKWTRFIPKCSRGPTQISWKSCRVLESLHNILEVLHNPGIMTQYPGFLTAYPVMPNTISWNCYAISWTHQTISKLNHDTLEFTYTNPEYSLAPTQSPGNLAETCNHHIISWNPGIATQEFLEHS